MDPRISAANASQRVTTPIASGESIGFGGLEREIKVLRAERDELAARFAALPRSTAHVVTQLTEADKALLAIRQARDAMMARSAELSEKLAEANDQIAELSDARDFAERERDAAMEQLQAAHRECAELRTKLDSVKEQNTHPAPALVAGQSMAALIAQYSAERIRLQQQLEEVRTAASVQAAALQAQLAARKHEAAATGELDRQRLEMAELRAELDSMREELRQSRAAKRESEVGAASVEIPSDPAPAPVMEHSPLPAEIKVESGSDLEAMAMSLGTVRADPSQLEVLDVLASQFQDFAQKCLTAGNSAAHRLSSTCADVALWLRKSPSKIPAASPSLEKARLLLGRLTLPTAPTVADPGGATIYAVDDDVDNCECIAMALEKAALLTRYSIRADVAQTELAKAPCDLIVLDVDLGGDVDGFELYKRIRNLEPHRRTPVLFVSGLTSTPERIAELTGERDAFVQKPYNLNELTLHVLSSILNFRLENG